MYAILMIHVLAIDQDGMGPKMVVEAGKMNHKIKIFSILRTIFASISI